ncbi:HAMP domain-containing sensor histidine kinase [Hyphomicrobium sp. CS1GBMeth3]|uniref:sensor histidine kinase n=1 Tax=Hyphomicrobium sp. CS1GBMeth3 TaxID=1892845 RepID=UPI00092FDF7B|nr:HAMP domain-containing sensor histidine kinase [Hyphomicrobium sp. CS1GBMeth3]
MIRVGFGARLFLIVATALVALQLLLVAGYFLQRSRDTETGFRLPFPDQAAALVELLETTPSDQWPALLRAVNSPDLRVRLDDGPPQGTEAAWFEAPVAALITRRYLAALGDRPVRVTVEASSELFEGPMRALAWASPGSVEIQVGLRSGKSLVIGTGGVLSLSMLGFPPGFWAGLIGFGIAAVTIVMLGREARPLRELADAVDRFNLPDTSEPIADAPRSAPEIRALISAFNRLTERVANLLRTRMMIVGGISHDLRTYAARLRLRAELIPDADERAKAVRDLDDMSRLLSDSLTALEADAKERAEELFDVAPLLEREVDDRRRAGATVSLSVSPEAGAAQVLGDPLAFRRLLANVTDNAVAYGGSAEISAHVNAGTLTISVDDQGPGISPEMRQRVMEPFVRLEASRNRRTGGAGLGLAIAQKAARLNGGTLELRDAPRCGLRALIRLPVFGTAAVGFGTNESS